MAFSPRLLRRGDPSDHEANRTLANTRTVISAMKELEWRNVEGMGEGWRGYRDKRVGEEGAGWRRIWRRSQEGGG